MEGAMSNAIEVAGFRFTPNKDGFLVTRPYAGGEAISGQFPIAALDTLRAAYDAHERDVVRPWNALVDAWRTLQAQKGARFASERLRAIAGVDELGSVRRERFADVTAALIAAVAS
jgi:hypothetical protein